MTTLGKLPVTNAPVLYAGIGQFLDEEFGRALFGPDVKIDDARVFGYNLTILEPHDIAYLLREKNKDTTTPEDFRTYVLRKSFSDEDYIDIKTYEIDMHQYNSTLKIDCMAQILDPSETLLRIRDKAGERHPARARIITADVGIIIPSRFEQESEGKIFFEPDFYLNDRQTDLKNANDIRRQSELLREVPVLNEAAIFYRMPNRER